ncbi:MAG: glycosyltransferase family 2 protein, partial [Limisphaerales bacterium]
MLNFNGTPWLEKCFRSLRSQTVFDQLELILADNNSPDGSARLAERLLCDWPKAKVMQHGQNLGFCEGNNRAAREARGDYLFFLNNDTWLEEDCLEKLVARVEQMEAQAGTPLMLNYEDSSVQSAGGQGFDIFGLMSLA